MNDAGLIRLSYTTHCDGGTWFAMLGQRHIGATGPTEHSAVTKLMNYVAELAARGLLSEKS